MTTIMAKNAAETLRLVIYLHDMRAAFLGQSLGLAPHKVSVATIAVGLDKAFELDFLDDAEPSCCTCRVALIAPDRMHHLRASERMFFLYLDPLSSDYVGLDAALIARLDATADQTATAILAAAASHSDAEGFLYAVSRIFDLPDPPRTDQRISRTLRAIDAAPQEFVSVDKAAAFACMSVSRFQHIFRDVTGTTFRRYRLWKRMTIVAHHLAAQASLTDAATEAGFSSSSHLSTAFKDMFGIRPSDLAGHSVDLRAG